MAPLKPVANRAGVCGVCAVCCIIVFCRGEMKDWIQCVGGRVARECMSLTLIQPCLHITHCRVNRVGRNSLLL